MPAFTTLLGRSTAAVVAFNGTMQPGYTYRGYEYQAGGCLNTTRPSSYPLPARFLPRDKTNWTRLANRILVGCAAEGKTGHALQSGYLGDVGGMTIEKCIEYCGTKNMPLLGLEYGKDCYCGKTLLEGSTFYPNQAKCNMKCPGNDQQTCGGSLSISIFNNTRITSPKPPSKVGTWAFDTCYMEPAMGRVLPDVLWVKNGMTMDMCTSYCATNGNYKYGGVEDGNRCFCGRQITAGVKNAYDMDCPMTCDVPCPGNDKQICGANGVITVYRNTA